MDKRVYVTQITAYALFLFGFAAHASPCLDISGTYDMSRISAPSCGDEKIAIKGWYKFQQDQCTQISFSKIYKFQDGTFCESTPSVSIADGVEHQSAYPQFAYKYEMYSDHHVITWRTLATGEVVSETKTMDTKGNQISDTSDGQHGVLYQSPVE